MFTFENSVNSVSISPSALTPKLLGKALISGTIAGAADVLCSRSALLGTIGARGGLTTMIGGGTLGISLSINSYPTPINKRIATNTKLVRALFLSKILLSHGTLALR